MNLITIVFSLIFSASQDAPQRSRALEDGRFQTTTEGVAIDGQLVEAPSPPKRLRLAILPDRTTGRSWGIPYLEAAVEDLRRLQPDAVFCVGDLVQGYTRNTEQWDSEVDEYLSIVGRLNSDFYPTAGNHDVISGARDPDDHTFIDRYRKRFGPVNYAVEIDEATIVVLFSDEALDDRNVQFSEEQLTWLEGVLTHASEREGPIVLLMHRPLWRYKGVEWDRRVHPLLVKHGADAVIAGHFHALQRDPDRDGIQYHILGVCGGAIDQHPLTGQLHHLSLLDLGPEDEVSIVHMPVGMTLPDDFVTESDQQRAFTLKRSRKAAQVSGALPDPFNGPVDANVNIVLNNPIDRPLSFAVSPAKRIDHWHLENLPFMANTPADIRNESTTDYDTSFIIHTEDAPLTVPAGESKTIKLNVTSPATSSPARPLELLITTTFIDEKSREVPVYLHRRVPIVRYAAADDTETRFPISAWRHTVYEVPEADSWVRFDFTNQIPRLYLHIEDDLFSSAGIDNATILNTRRNPPGDLVRITVDTDDGRREFLLEPTDEHMFLLEVLNHETAPRIWTKQWKIESQDLGNLELQIDLPEVDSIGVKGVQVEVADNDSTYHTQWRRLAPSGKMVQIIQSGP